MGAGGELRAQPGGGGVARGALVGELRMQGLGLGLLRAAGRAHLPLQRLDLGAQPALRAALRGLLRDPGLAGLDLLLQARRGDDAIFELPPQRRLRPAQQPQVLLHLRRGLLLAPSLGAPRRALGLRGGEPVLARAELTERLLKLPASRVLLAAEAVAQSPHLGVGLPGGPVQRCNGLAVLVAVSGLLREPCLASSDLVFELRPGRRPALQLLRKPRLASSDLFFEFRPGNSPVLELL
mmetsp:Transcript_128097/g.319675  ORF Transcript_128097/g.319675 Transcript_128097/m.319675 type:complete len:238 (+) Transcript_128097:823-1536(+)